MIGYYVHHHGRGHLLRAEAIRTALTGPVTVLTSLPRSSTESFDDVVTLPRDDAGTRPQQVTASGVLHWVPRHDPGLDARMATISGWIHRARPDALVVDVSVEVALLARLHGIPVITMVLPGTRTDRPHRLVHDIADALIAAWPRELYEPPWLRDYHHKTHYVGGISRYPDAPTAPSRPVPDRPDLTVVAGAGGTDITGDAVDHYARHLPQYHWRTAGLHGWTADLWPELRAADVVLACAGQGTIADIAAARRPAIIVPAPRPFGEQDATAAALRTAGLATVLDHWPPPERWPRLIEAACATDPNRWRLWRTRGAARRAAEVIETVRAAGTRTR